MKPTHLTSPRTLGEGHFARGYTTQPAGRRVSDYSRGWYFLVGLISGLGLAVVVVTA